MEQPTYIILQGGDSHNAGISCGLKTAIKIEALIDYITADLNKGKCFVVIITAGKNPKKPSHSALKLKIRDTLKGKLERLYGSGKISIVPKLVLVSDDAWGMFEEVAAAAKILKTLGITSCWMISFWYEWPLMKLAWLKIPELKVHPLTQW